MNKHLKCNILKQQARNLPDYVLGYYVELVKQYNQCEQNSSSNNSSDLGLTT